MKMVLQLDSALQNIKLRNTKTFDIDPILFCINFLCIYISDPYRTVRLIKFQIEIFN